MKGKLFLMCLIGLSFMLLLIVGCGKTPSEPQPPVEGEVECVTDDDCLKGGCSSTICQSRDAPPVFTTCEYLPEYDCYKGIECGCVNGKCDWGKTVEFDKCVSKARESDEELVV